MRSELESDPILTHIIKTLRTKYKCHTVMLYGSCARGDATDLSDYDVMGVRRSGEKLRIAKKFRGVYLDLFVFPESDLQKIGEEHFYMKGSKILHSDNNFGNLFLKRLAQALKKPFKPLPKYERDVRCAWAMKMLERTKKDDLEGNYRRSWLQMALLEDYFAIRSMRYEGSKASFAWLKVNDKAVYSAFEKALNRPNDFSLLEKLVKKVVNFKLRRGR